MNCPRCERHAAYWPIFGAAYVVGTWVPARYSVFAAAATVVIGWLFVFLVRSGRVRVPARLSERRLGWWSVLVFLVLWFGPMFCPWTVVAWSK